MGIYPIQFSKIRRKIIVDSEDVEIGEPVDIGFSLELEPKFFVVGGGFIEELLEMLKRREDVDQLVKLDQIESISDAIYLNVAETELLRSENLSLMDEGIVLFSEICRIPLFDGNGIPLGNVKDVVFSPDKTEFIFSDPQFNRQMAEKGYGQRIEFILPKSYFSFQPGLLSISLLKEDIENKALKEVVPKKRGKQVIAPV